MEENLPNQDDYFRKLQQTKRLKMNMVKQIVSVGDCQKEKMERKRKQDASWNLKEFSNLMAYLSNLQELDLDDWKNYDAYMAFLREIDSTTHLKRIERIVEMVNFRTLQPITTFAIHSHMLQLSVTIQL